MNAGREGNLQDSLPNLQRRGLNEPAIAGGILVAPGVSPGFEHHSVHQARKAGDRNSLENHMRAGISFRPLRGSEFFRCSVPELTPGATDMPPALQAGKALS